MIYKSNEPRVTQEDIQNSRVVTQKYWQLLHVCITIQVSTVGWKPSENAMILLGYLPITKLNSILPSKRSSIQHQLFHNCMKELLQPLIKARTNSVKMLCSNSKVQLVFPILSAYLANHPEQCLIVCCKENHCPKCLIPQLEWRNPAFWSQLCDVEETLEILQAASLSMDKTDQFGAHSL